MKLFKCLVTGDEVFCDTYKFEEKDGIFFIKAEYKAEKSDDIDDSLIGGNKSAEGLDEDESGGAAETKMVIDVISAGRMIEVGFNKYSDYAVQHLKPFLKQIQAKLIEKELLEDDPAKIKAWQTGIASAVMKHLKPEFKDLQFFMGGSMDITGTLAAVKWEGETPMVMVLKDGLEEEKL